MELQNQVYVLKNLTRYPSIIHGISSIAFGSMKDINTLQIDRKALSKFAEALDITDDIICMKQIHSGNVSIIENSNELAISETDALVTNKRHIPLAVLTADCLPIVFYDPNKEVIGLAHAGYKGLLHHVIENTIRRLQSDFKSDPKDIIVGIGPSIERDCYEVGEEVIQKFKETFPDFGNMFINNEKSEGKYFLGLRGIARQSLIKEGILKENIEVMDICTKCDPNFYSYRGGDGDKRFVSLISINS